MKDLRGKLVLITGGARGIGRATAVELARKGARVALADVDLELAQQTARELGSFGLCHAYPLDVRDHAQFCQLVERIEPEHGPVDVLVNNAGIMSLGGFVEQSPENDRRQVDINLFGVLNGMRAVLPRMVERGAGHVVNIASLAGRVGTPHAVTYSATKFGVIGATEAIRAELRGKGVGFSYVMPYLVNTELAAGTKALPWPPVVEPEDVARAVVRAVEREELEVYVPRIGRLTASLPAVLPRSVVDWIAAKMGLHRLFRRIDQQERAAYVARTTGATDERPRIRVVG